MSRIIRAVTLIELMVSIVLLSVVVLGLATIDTFSGFHVRNAEQRVKVQYEASIALEHITKELSKAIGNETIPGWIVVNTASIGGNPAIKVYVDANENGRRDAVGTDLWIAYRYVAGSYLLRFCPNCTDGMPCTACSPAWGTSDNNIAWSISAFNVIKPVNGSGQLNNNYVTVQVTACWDPAQTTDACGTSNNPSVTASGTIKMPSVSTN